MFKEWQGKVRKGEERSGKITKGKQENMITTTIGRKSGMGVGGCFGWRMLQMGDIGMTLTKWEILFSFPQQMADVG